MYTDKKYWQNYYKNSSALRSKIIFICKPYDKYWDILFNACKNDPKTILEVGAYPGRFIAYVASKFNLQPTALDYNPDSTKIEKSFQEMGINDYEIIIDDITSSTPEKKYDLIISMGFIEHFEDYNSILDKHAEMLAKGGAILITVPNKRGIRQLYGLLCDKRNLNTHNLKCMNKKTFYNFALKNKLNIECLEYFGGFQYSVHQQLNFVQKGIYYCIKFISIKLKIYIERYPSWLYSSGIIAIYSKE